MRSSSAARDRVRSASWRDADGRHQKRHGRRSLSSATYARVCFLVSSLADGLGALFTAAADADNVVPLRAAVKR
jgi:hypothetical protein